MIIRLAKLQFYEMDRWDGGCIINLTPWDRLIDHRAYVNRLPER
jgi:hypothetical protein